MFKLNAFAYLIILCESFAENWPHLYISLYLKKCQSNLLIVALWLVTCSHIWQINLSLPVMCLRSTPDILPVTCCYQRAKITSCETTYNNDSIWQWGWKRPFVVPLYYQWVKKAKWWRRQKCFCLSCALTVEADLLIYCYYYFMRFILSKIIDIKIRFNIKKEERD